MRDSEQVAASVPAPETTDFFGENSPAVNGAAAVILVLAISVIDKLTGFDLQIGVLHLIPIAMMTWGAGRAWGVALALLASGLWLVLFRGSHHYWTDLHYYWYAAVQLGIFLAFVLIIARLREALRMREVGFLDKLNAPAYVADLERGVILYGNAAFHDTLAERTMPELALYPAKEAPVTWHDGRRAVLRILTL